MKINHTKYIDTIRFLKEGWDFENYEWKGISGKVKRTECVCGVDCYCACTTIISFSEKKLDLGKLIDSLFGFPYEIKPDAIVDRAIRAANLSIDDFEFRAEPGYYGEEAYVSLKKEKYDWIENHLICIQYLNSEEEKQEYLNTIKSYTDE